jgi:hypothetical protein
MRRLSQYLTFVFCLMAGALVPVAFVVSRYGPPSRSSATPDTALGTLLAIPVGGIVGAILGAMIIERAPRTDPDAPRTAYDWAAAALALAVTVFIAFLVIRYYA